MNDIVDAESRNRSLRTIGHISYLLHAIVAVSAVIPGVQASVGLLIVAFILDLVKRDDAAGTWQESHFRWRIRSELWAFGLYVVTAPQWLLLFQPRQPFAPATPTRATWRGSCTRAPTRS